jgi:hypothetical protein
MSQSVFKWLKISMFYTVFDMIDILMSSCQNQKSFSSYYSANSEGIRKSVCTVTIFKRF